MPISSGADEANSHSAPQGGPILLTGVTGQLGGELLKALSLVGTVISPPRATLDLQSPDSIKEMVRALRPRWIVNAAAYTAVDLAESNRIDAFAINADAVGFLADAASSVGARVLHYSTDYVFSGDQSTPYKETDPTGPLNVYGESKLEGERRLLESGATHIVLRTSWVFGGSGRNFLKTIVRLAAERDELRIVSDQHGAPTCSEDLAAITRELILNYDRIAGADEPASHAPTLSGIYHAAGTGSTSWFEFASAIVDELRARQPSRTWAEVHPLTSEEYPTPARRPRNSRLNCDKLEAAFGLRLPSWQDSVKRVIGSLA